MGARRIFLERVDVGRKHALKLRRLVLGAGLGVALASTLTQLVAGPLMPVPLSLLAVIAAGFAVVVERWLFFAEAQHIVTLYYGAEAA